MKRIKLIATIAILASLAAISSNALAQRGQGKGMMENPDRAPQMQKFIPNLTPEQEVKISELRTAHLKEVTPLRNELGEKRARLRTLESADKPDMNAINKTIDEMAVIKANIQKLRASHRANVSAQLTD